MKLKLRCGDIDLPSELALEERQELVEDILAKYPEEFQYTLSEKMNRVIEVRLDILATYMLNAVPDIRDNVMSRYKEKDRPIREKPFSEMTQQDMEAVGL